MFHPDLDKLAATMPPWAMRVTIGGVSYAVRQPTLAEDEQLAAMIKQRDLTIIVLGKRYKTRRPAMWEYGALLDLGNVNDEEGTKLVVSLFDPPLEKLDWPLAWIQGFLITYMVYFLSKNKQDQTGIAKAIRDAMKHAVGEKVDAEQVV